MDDYTDFDDDGVVLYDNAKKERTIKIIGGVVIGLVCVLLLLIIFGIVIFFVGASTCSTDDSSQNVENSSSNSPSPTATSSVSPVVHEYWENISMEGVKSHLQSLQLIANENGGTRSITSTGFNASMDYIESQLTANTNLILTRQPFTVTMPVQLEDPVFQSVSPTQVTYKNQIDYSPLQYSGSGNITERMIAIPNYGCNIEDFANFTAGCIALIQRGNCTFNLKATNAVQFGAIGVLVSNNETLTAPTQGTLGDIVSIPVFGITYSLGQSFIAAPETQVNLYYNAEIRVIYTSNLIAETTTGNEDAIVTIGSHLDSVDAGPGINDNGSGSSANLQMALQFVNEVQFVNKVRFLWYGAEEEGLLGSTFYVNSLSDDEKNAIALNLNFDMLGSPNFIRGILNGTDSPMHGSQVIMETFENFFTSNQLTYDIIPFTGRSDYGPYLEAGIPAGGVETGAELIKDQAGRTKFGGLANTPYDPCYHQACDTIENVNMDVLTQTTQAAAFALQKFSTDPNLRETLNR